MQYKVKTLSVGGRGNKIFYYGETVSDENFPGSNAKDLVKSGHLEPINKESVEIIETVSSVEEAEEVDLSNLNPEVKSYEEITVKELREITGNSDPKLRKADLYDMYVNQMN